MTTPDQPLNVLMFTRRLDQADWLAGFAHGWVTHLAAHPGINRLHVICLEAGQHDLPANVSVTSMGKERGVGRAAQLVNLWRAVSQVISGVDVVFGHMIPRYTLAAAPLIVPRGVPIVQWYTHRQVTWELRLVHALAAQVVTASPESFRLASHKLSVLGHGIDMRVFHPAEVPPQGQVIAAVGRLSPIKHYETLIEAAALLRQDPALAGLRIEIAGGVPPGSEAYAEALHSQVERLGLAGCVIFCGPVPHPEVPAWLRRASLSVNLCPTGGVDKAVIESMASGLPIVVRNDTFLPLLEDQRHLLHRPSLDAAALADQLRTLLHLPAEQRTEIGQALRRRAQAGYDLDGLIDRLVGVLRRAAERRGLSKGGHRAYNPKQTKE